ncbi:hypothetical protein Salat_1419600 [Sesamum alatum]|uniref:Aminotransferase-like plant mobile domain-containing protein n=1 Tax=Sesamum alatum TaxID=300844 RepID=A0AAE1YAF0_9LAMI|nr:hypothetical protein Salat_1419600 [Sesamum alatum]
MIFHNVDSVYVPLLYLYFLKDISPKKLNSFVWGAAALSRIQSGLKSTKTFKRGSWLLECFILERIPRIRSNYIGAAYRLDLFPSLSAPTLIGWSKMLERPSKNRYLDEDHSKQILSGVTVEDVEWRPYERLQQKQSQMLSLEPQRIFFTASVLFYYQLINYDMPELAPHRLGTHRRFTVPKRCTKKVKSKGKDDGPNAPSEDAPLDDHPNDIVDPSSTGLNDTLDFDGPDVQNDEPCAPPEMRPSMIIPMSLSIILLLA